MPVMLIKNALDTDCVSASFAEVLNGLVLVPWARDGSCCKRVDLGIIGLHLLGLFLIDCLHSLVCNQQPEELLVSTELFGIGSCDRPLAFLIWTVHWWFGLL